MTSMNQEEIYSNVVSIICQHSKNKEAIKSVTKETDIYQDLQVNSARFVDIILDFEDKFGCEIADEDADGINTIGDAIELVQKNLH